MIWNLVGTEHQNELIQSALAACDFPFDELLPSLQREGKSSISAEWQDLSRFAVHGQHTHVDGAHGIVREVEGRARVLGLFYLPPYTRVVMENTLVNHPALAQEVFLAEAAHAVDYHYMVGRELRKEVWNALHTEQQHVDKEVIESGDVGHGHSWFDGPGGYNTWVGESFMAAFIRAFAPSVQVTINLDHPVTDAAAEKIRQSLLPPESEQPALSAVFVSKGGQAYHDSHKRIRQDRWFDSYVEAEEAGFRPCKTCKPRQ